MPTASALKPSIMMLMMVAALALVTAPVRGQGFDNNNPGLEGYLSQREFVIDHNNPNNPLSIRGRVFGVDHYSAADWNNWVGSVECQNSSHPRCHYQSCAREALISALSHAIEKVNNDPNLVCNNERNSAMVAAIGPELANLNRFQYYLENHGQGPSCPTCTRDQFSGAHTWDGSFLPNGEVYYLKTRKIKVTCKSSCLARDINMSNVAATVGDVQLKIRESQGAGANFFLYRKFNNQIMARCRVTYAQGSWFNRVFAHPDQVLPPTAPDSPPCHYVP